MIYLIQIFRLLDNNADFDLFESIFSDLDFEIEELGYKHCPEDLIFDLLENHFSITMTDDRQLKRLTDSILDKRMFESAIALEKLRRL